MNTINTYDLHSRLDKLRGLKDAAKLTESALNELASSDEINESELEEAKSDFDSATEAFGDEEQRELSELEEICNQVSNWDCGEILIPEDDFVEYCQELCKDIGNIPKDLPSYIVIDWPETAERLRPDYAECEYNGVTYLYISV